MSAVYRKQLKSLFLSPFGYAFVCVYLLVGGVCLSLFNLLSGSADLSYTATVMTLLLIPSVPLLCARSLVAERRAGTHLFLYSLPLSSASIVWGHYLSSLTLLAIPSGAVALVTLLFSAWSEVPLSMFALTWLGYFLLAAALLAIGTLLSSLFSRPLPCGLFTAGVTVGLYCVSLFSWALPESAPLSLFLFLLLETLVGLLLLRVTRSRTLSAVVAGLLGAATLILFFVEPSVFRGSFAKLLSSVDLFNRSAAMSWGRLDLSVAFLYAGVIAVCLLLSARRVERQRSGRGKPRPAFLSRQALKSIAILGLVLVLLAVNLSLPLLPDRVIRPDFGKNDAFALSAETRDVLNALDIPVTLYLLSQGGEQSAGGELYDFLKQYDESSALLTLRVVDPNNDRALLSAYPEAASMSDMSLIVASDRRVQMLDNAALYYYSNAYVGDDRITPAEYVYFCSVLGQQSGTEMLYAFLSSTVMYFDGQSRVTNAIRTVTAERIPTVYTYSGSGATGLDSHLADLLTLGGYAIKSLPSAATVPTDCDLLVISAPSTDLADAELDGLDAYLSRGGKIFLTTRCDKTDLPKLNALLSSYGLSFEDRPSVVCEENAAYCYTDATYGVTYPNVFFARIKQTPLTAGFTGSFILSNPHAIRTADADGVTVTPWLTATDGYLTYLDVEEEERTEQTSPYVVGAISERTDGGTLVWIASAEALSSVADTYSEGGNFDLAVRCFDVLCQNEIGVLSLPSVPMRSTALSAPAVPALLLALLLVVILPLGVGITGGVILHARKKK